MRRRFTYKNNSWNVDRYLTIVSLEDGLTVSFENDLEYCINNDYNWEILKKGEESKKIDKGNRISFRANLTPTIGIGTFTINKKCNLKGNCGSLLYGDSANLYDYVSMYSFYNLFYGCDTIKEVSPYLLPFTRLGASCYEYMFYGCTSLVNAPELPATNLAGSCYNGMFENCRSLVHAPELPAVQLAENCYNSMFYGCTSLVNAPELPATNLAGSCYNGMFGGCANLNYIKMLATDISADYCLEGWVYGVSSTGTFVKSKDATWDVRGASGIPEGWTVVNDGEEGGNDFGIEFPLYLEFDSCEAIDEWSTVCVRKSDEISVKLRDYFIQIAIEYGTNSTEGYIVTEQELDLLGVEVYIDSQKVTYYTYADTMIINVQSVYDHIMFREDGTLYFEGLL